MTAHALAQGRVLDQRQLEPALGAAIHALSVALLLLPFALRGQVNDAARFALATAVLVLYLCVEISLVWWREPHRWLLHAGVVGSIGSFIVPLGLTNLTMLDASSDGYTRLVTGLQGGDGYYWLARAMELAIIAAGAMWMGFRVPLGAGLGGAMRATLERRHVLRAREIPRRFVVGGLLATALIARTIQLKLGVLGYAGEIENLYAYAQYTMFLSMGSDLATLALVIVALEHFSPGGRPRTVLLLAMLVFEMAFGFILGFKGRVVMPLMTVAICSYAARGRVPLRYAVAGVIALTMAYMVIEPFRLLRNIDPDFRGTSLVSIVKSLKVAGALSGSDGPRSFTASDLVSMTAQRTNYALDAAVVMRYRATHQLDENAPAFLLNLLTSPIQAVIPRVVWKNKPVQNIGLWYAQTVWGQETDKNSLGMSPFGYLYFSGGSLMVFFGFFALGMFQRMLYATFRFAGLGGLLVYLAILPNIAVADHAFYAVFAGTIQILIVTLFVQRLVLVTPKSAT